MPNNIMYLKYKNNKFDRKKLPENGITTTTINIKIKNVHNNSSLME